MKITIRSYLNYYQAEWQETGEYSIDNVAMDDHPPQWVCLGQREFEVEVPDTFDPRPLQIAALNEQKKKVMADAQVKVNAIDETIQRLLAIEDKREVVS